MASPASQSHLITLATLLQLLRGATWVTLGLIVLVQAVDPSIGASVNALHALPARKLALAVLGALAIGNGGLQAWAGYHVSTWRKTKLWIIAVAIPAADAVAWAEAALRLDARGEANFALAGFILCGLAALAAIAVASGRTSLTGEF